MSDDMGSVIGRPIDRVDGTLKITGAARYAAEFDQPGLAYAVLVQSTVPRGRIRRIDSAVAARTPGVLLVLTHQNAPALPQHGMAAVQTIEVSHRQDRVNLMASGTTGERGF